MMGLGSGGRLVRRALTVLLVTTVLVTGIPVDVPVFGPQRAEADPGTYITADPQQFSPARGERTEISWDYDYGHPTLIEVFSGGVAIVAVSRYYGGGDNSWYWNGRDSSGAIVPDGAYLVRVTPDDEFSQYAQSTVVYVYNPPPSVPTVGVSTDADGNLLAGGTGDPGSGITVYIDNVRAGGTQVGGAGEWQLPLNVSPDTVHSAAAVASYLGKTSDVSTPERFLQHEVAPGEVLSQTADHYYMTGGDTSTIRNANSGVEIRPGTRILVPDPVVGGTPTATKTVPPTTGSGFGPYSHAGKTEDPINTSTGAFLFDRVDLVVPGKPDLVIRRSYTSGDPYEGPLGYGWHFTYDVRAVLNVDESIDIFRENGARDRFVIGADGKYRPEQPGVFDKLELKSDGGVTLEMQDRTVQVFNSDGLLTETRDRNGNKATLEYEDGYRLRRVLNSTGQYLVFDYGDDARIDTVTDSAGRSLTYGYDAAHDLASVTMPDGGIWDYDYDANHRFATAIGPLGHVYVTNEYDADGRVVRQTDSLGKVTDVEYDRAHFRTIFTDGSGSQTIDTFDEYDRLVHRTDALGDTEYYTYNDAGSLESHTDGNGRATFYYYDEGRLTLVRDPLGKETTFHYDDRGDLHEVIDHVGRKSVMTYDDAGNVKTITDPTGAVTGFDYDAFGNLLKLTNAIGEWSNYHCDPSGRLDALTDALGNAFGFTHDASGNLTGTSGPGGMSTQSVSDWAGRPLTATDALGNTTSFVYDSEGNLKTMTDARGSVYTFDYDAMGNVRQIVDPLGQVTTLENDGSGRVKKMTAPGSAVTEYEYDAAGQLSRVITDKQLASYTFDIANRLIAFTDNRGQEAQFAYDPEGRRTQRTQTLLWRGPGKGNAYAYGHDHAPGQQDDFTPPGQEGKESKNSGSGDVNRSIRTPDTSVLIAEKPATPPGQDKQDGGNGGGGSDSGNNGNGNGSSGVNGAADDKLTGQDKENDHGQGNGQGNGKGGKDKGDKGKGTDQEKPKYFTEVLNLVNDLASPMGEALAAYGASPTTSSASRSPSAALTRRIRRDTATSASPVSPMISARASRT